MNKRSITLFDLGRMPYGDALALQREYLAKRIAGEIGDTLLLVEHDPVITLGRSANRDNILAAKDALSRIGVEVFEIERGGDVTYHGPGQQVGYPIINIREFGVNLHEYLRLLEEALIEALKGFDLVGCRIEGLTGVFVGDSKVAAIGIAVKKWVTFHGFAFNVNPNLSHFELIVPCGIRDHTVCSLAGLLQKKTLTLSDFRKPLLNSFSNVFNVEIIYAS